MTSSNAALLDEIGWREVDERAAPRKRGPLISDPMPSRSGHFLIVIPAGAVSVPAGRCEELAVPDRIDGHRALGDSDDVPGGVLHAQIPGHQLWYTRRPQHGSALGGYEMSWLFASRLVGRRPLGLASGAAVLALVLAPSIRASAATGDFKTVDVPGAAGTLLAGIDDDNVIAVNYTDSAGTQFGALYRNGTFMFLNDPAAGAGPGQGTLPITPKDTGHDGNVLRNTTVVGWYVDSHNRYHGFVYRAGRFTNFEDPRAGTGSFRGTVAYDMTSNGTIVGQYLDARGVTHGYLDHDGRFTTIDNPFAGTASGQGTALDGGNANGVLVGTYTDSANVTHGFTLHDGTFTAINDPSAGTAAFQGTFSFESNRSGLIVGFYTDSSNMNHGMTYKNGVFTTIDDPKGAMGTTAQGVNDTGRTVGDYHDTNNVDHGYIYTP